MTASEKSGITRPPRRDVHGVLLLDKPLGLSSNSALQVVKGVFRARKAGHGGSLDPLATGLLPCLLGEATKISGQLLEARKNYRFVAQLGVTTSTGDREGAVLEERAVPLLSQDDVESVLKRFRGCISQLPPMYSALKLNGQPLYKLARQGVSVERQARMVTIHQLTLVGCDGDRLEAEVCCSKGTYVRTLAEDIGSALGCGAHLISLRRFGVTPYDAARMVTLEQLRELAQDLTALDDLLLPVDSALYEWPAVQLGSDAAYFFCCGNPVRTSADSINGAVRVYADSSRFLGIGDVIDGGMVVPRRVLNL